jgi:hypothetical protein
MIVLRKHGLAMHPVVRLEESGLTADISADDVVVCVIEYLV